MLELMLRTAVVFIALLFAGIAVLMLTRGLRGKEVFTDRDWLFLFGLSKSEVLTLEYWKRFGIALAIASFAGFALSFVVAPFGSDWLLIFLIIALLGILFFVPAYIRRVGSH